MLLRSLFLINHGLFAAICLSLCLTGNASPIIRSHTREARFDLSTGNTRIRRAAQSNHNGGREWDRNLGIKDNQQSWRPRRQSRDLSAVASQDGPEIIGNRASGLTRNPKSTEIRRRSEIVQSEVIPKDPNSFFHPASLQQFKENVAAFKAWKQSKLLPDENTLARSKAEDVADKLDNFIEEISIKDAPLDRVEKPALTSYY